ncbi:MAG: CmcJ/NvfI family oxidoreductase [Gammaproteobacteria bacterium]|nr:CmcJ/NvfI family oxidoreductase [Gammaproteobacteria bacterium]
MAVLADVRYLNDEWRDRAEIPVVGDRGSRRANTAKHVVEIHDARDALRRGDITLDANGFALLRHASAVRNFRDDEQIRDIYYPEILALAKRTTGARDVVITQHVVRTEDTSDFNKAYARFLHCDYTLEDPRGLAERALARRDLDIGNYSNCEFAWFNTWQPFDHTVDRNPLAVVDASTVSTEDVLDYYYTGYGQKGKSAMPLRDPAHRFYYVPRMKTDELLFLKQLDTREGVSKVCPHTSFDDATSPADAPPRRSIEVRVMAVFDA